MAVRVLTFAALYQIFFFECLGFHEYAFNLYFLVSIALRN